MELLDWILSICGTCDSPQSLGPSGTIQHALEEGRYAPRGQAIMEQEEDRALEESYPQNRLYLPKYIVGIDGPIQDVEALLVYHRTLALVGMGGVGKTILAKAIFNKLGMEFEYSCFVGDVKLIQGGVEDIKSEIWSHMHRGGKQMAREPNWSLLKEKSLLLVLDDVATDRDLDVLFGIAECVAAGSRFIVTSRDKHLNRLDILYDVSFLNEPSARELFMGLAFPEKNVPPSQFESLVDTIVKKCEGLPLALEVLGKYLSWQDENGWKKTLDALDKPELLAAPERLSLKLRNTFDSLREKEKQVFLDAATFFRGNCTLSEAKVAWRAAYKPASESLLWKSLVDHGLVYDVNEEEVIRIHEALLSLGRNIATESGYRRRVWQRMEALKLLRSSELHDQAIHALRLEPEDWGSPEVSVSRSGLLSLEQVQYLHVHGKVTVDNAEGDELVPFLTNLVFLKCVGVGRQFIHLLFQSGLNRLVVLNLSNYDGEDLPFSFTELSPRLGMLKLSECKQLKSLPEDIVHLNLQFMEIRNCGEFQELPLSFGATSNLSDNLRHLQLIGCCNLHKLPESFGQLRTLKTLQLHQCRGLHALPDSFGQLSNLEHLQLQCELRSLPESFGCLSRLEYLKFLYCNKMQTLPHSFGSLSSLYHLEFNHCHSLHSLPDSFPALPQLRNLQFTECSMLHTLPESFGCLSSLIELQFTECHELHTLPESFGYLSAVSNLQFRCCNKLHSLPESLGQLYSLRHLRLEQCEALSALPNTFNRSMKLEILEISFCLRIKILPDSFAELSALSHLSVEMVALTTVPDSILRLSSLQVLEVGTLPFVKELPSWLGEPEASLPKTSRKIFHVQDRKFALAEEHKLELCDQWRLICGVHRRAMNLVKESKFFEALGSLNGSNTDASELQLQSRLVLFGASYKPVQPQVFFLQERGILKRLAGDLVGALEDLTYAFEVGLSRTFPDFRKEHRYDCLKHRAYVKYLQKDLDGARRDAEEALSIRCERCDGSESAPGRKDYLGEDSVKFLKFQLN